MGEGHCGSSIRTVECYSAMVKCGEFTQATTWVTPGLYYTERSLTRRNLHCVIPSVERSEPGKTNQG